MPIAQTSLSVTPDQGQQKPLDLASQLGEGLKTGIQLATASDQVDSAKAKVADQKMELLQKQATAMTNRTKAAVFANSPASFEAIMKGNESYANAIGVPYNGEAIRAAWKDPALRLAAQREISNILNGGELKNPQAIVDMYGADSHVILQQLQESSYANAQVKNKDAQATKLEGMKNASAERIANINANAKVESAQVRLGPREEALASKEYSKMITGKEVLPHRQNLEQGAKDLSIINHALETGEMTTQTMDELSLGLSALVTNAKGSTGEERATQMYNNLRKWLTEKATHASLNGVVKIDDPETLQTMKEQFNRLMLTSAQNMKDSVALQMRDTEDPHIQKVQESALSRVNKFIDAKLAMGGMQGQPAQAPASAGSASQIPVGAPQAPPANDPVETAVQAGLKLNPKADPAKLRAAIAAKLGK